MQNINLKLLMIFDEIYKTRSLSKAAENLEMGQPAVSMSVAKFRRHFNDPLFIRTSGGMAPTPHAQELIQPVRQALDLLKMALGHQVVFDPLTSTRMFNLSVTGFGPRIIMPALLKRLRETAPSVRINLTNVSEHTPSWLESGEVDLAVGFLPDLRAGFFRQQLFKERFVCIVDAGHPRIKKRLSMKQFQSEPHLIVAPQGTGHGILERTLDQLAIRRIVGVRIPNFLGIPSTIDNSEFLATVPERFGLVLAQTGRIKVLNLPFPVPGYQVMQHWHERFSRDPGIKWLRTTMSDLFLE